MSSSVKGNSLLPRKYKDKGWTETGPSLETSPWTELKNGVYNSGPRDAIVKNEHQFWHGYNLYNFHAIRDSGEIIPFTPWERFESSGSAMGDFSVTVIVNGDIYSSSGNAPLNDGWLLSRADMEAYVDQYGLHLLASEAITKAAAKIYDQGADVLTSAAEFHKTLKMVKNLVRNFAKFTLKMQKAGVTSRTFDSLGDLKQTLKKVTQYGPQVRNAHQFWLQWRYGWRILMFEIMDIQKAINDMDLERTRYDQKSGEGYLYTNSFEQVRIGGAATTTYSYKDYVNISSRGHVIADVQPPQFQFANVAQTGWEIIPYSFVIDWLIDIGGWIRAMSFLTYQTDFEAARGFKLTVERSLVDVSSVPKPGWKDCVYNQSAGSTASLIVREPQSVIINPQVARPSLPTDTDEALQFIARIIDLVSIGMGGKAPRR